MTDRSGKPKPGTAAHLLAQLAADPEFQKRARDKEAAMQRKEASWRAAEAPMLVDLAEVGVHVESVWDLVNTAEPYPEALPVLVRHLESGDYPDRVLEGVARALAVKPAVAYWDRLKSVLLESESMPDRRQGVAVALAACATPAHLGELVDLVRTERLGPARIFFLRPIRDLGGDLGRSVLQSLVDDDVLGREAKALLARTFRRRRR